MGNLQGTLQQAQASVMLAELGDNVSVSSQASAIDVDMEPVTLETDAVLTAPQPSNAPGQNSRSMQPIPATMQTVGETTADGPGAADKGSNEVDVLSAEKFEQLRKLRDRFAAQSSSSTGTVQGVAEEETGGGDRRDSARNESPCFLKNDDSGVQQLRQAIAAVLLHAVQIRHLAANDGGAIAVCACCQSSPCSHSLHRADHLQADAAGLPLCTPCMGMARKEELTPEEAMSLCELMLLFDVARSESDRRQPRTSSPSDQLLESRQKMGKVEVHLSYNGSKQSLTMVLLGMAMRSTRLVRDCLVMAQACIVNRQERSPVEVISLSCRSSSHQPLAAGEVAWSQLFVWTSLPDEQVPQLKLEISFWQTTPQLLLGVANIPLSMASGTTSLKSQTFDIFHTHGLSDAQQVSTLPKPLQPRSKVEGFLDRLKYFLREDTFTITEPNKEMDAVIQPIATTKRERKEVDRTRIQSMAIPQDTEENLVVLQSVPSLIVFDVDLDEIADRNGQETLVPNPRHHDSFLEDDDEFFVPLSPRRPTDIRDLTPLRHQSSSDGRPSVTTPGEPGLMYAIPPLRKFSSASGPDCPTSDEDSSTHERTTHHHLSPSKLTTSKLRSLRTISPESTTDMPRSLDSPTTLERLPDSGAARSRSHSSVFQSPPSSSSAASIGSSIASTGLETVRRLDTTRQNQGFFADKARGDDVNNAAAAAAAAAANDGSPSVDHRSLTLDRLVAVRDEIAAKCTSDGDMPRDREELYSSSSSESLMPPDGLKLDNRAVSGDGGLAKSRHIYFSGVVDGQNELSPSKPSLYFPKGTVKYPDLQVSWSDRGDSVVVFVKRIRNLLAICNGKTLPLGIYCKAQLVTADGNRLKAKTRTVSFTQNPVLGESLTLHGELKDAELMVMVWASHGTLARHQLLCSRTLVSAGAENLAARTSFDSTTEASAAAALYHGDEELSTESTPLWYRMYSQVTSLPRHLSVGSSSTSTKIDRVRSLFRKQRNTSASTSGYRIRMSQSTGNLAVAN